MVLLAFIPSAKVEQADVPVFRVVIDPGHGGFFSRDKKKHGDKYDSVRGEYLEYFAEGANFKGLYEHEVVYSIALKVMERLALCSIDGDFDEFNDILSRFTSKSPGRIFIETMISRGESLPEKEKESSGDVNGPYRLYDYPDEEGNMTMGRISKINSFKPHLVVSLHLAETAPPDYLGMNGIIVPPYNVLKYGFKKLKKGKTGKFNDSGRLNSWFQESGRRSKRFYYFKDVSQYFTGYGITAKYRLDYDDYKGFKYNMVTWCYRDDPGWEEKAKQLMAGTPYSANYQTFSEDGRFWEREKSVYEEYRRGRSFKDFGGDNYYATYEILRYVLYSLGLEGVEGKTKIPGKPFISTWSVPLLVNAVSAYIELGYFDRKWDRDVLINRQEEIADGIAVGIYSLLAGLQDFKGNFRNMPSGKCIDLKKYDITNEKSYFDIVAGDEK